MTASDEPSPTPPGGSKDTAMCSGWPLSATPLILSAHLSCQLRQMFSWAAPPGPGTFSYWGLFSFSNSLCFSPPVEWKRCETNYDSSFCNSRVLELNVVALSFLSPLRGQRGLSSAVGDFLGPRCQMKSMTPLRLPG